MFLTEVVLDGGLSSYESMYRMSDSQYWTLESSPQSMISCSACLVSFGMIVPLCGWLGNPWASTWSFSDSEKSRGVWMVVLEVEHLKGVVEVLLQVLINDAFVTQVNKEAVGG